MAEPVDYERHGLDEASGSSYTVTLSISSSASTTAQNRDWGMQLFIVEEDDDCCSYYHFGIYGELTADHLRRTDDFLRGFPLAAAHDDALALIFEDAVDQVGGDCFHGFLMVEMTSDPDYLQHEIEMADLMMETLSQVQNYAPTPAGRDAVEALEKLTITGGDEEERTCAICLDEFSVGCEVTKMPCSHVFHGGCIGRWLQNRLDCPLCRFKLQSE